MKIITLIGLLVLLSACSDLELEKKRIAGFWKASTYGFEDAAARSDIYLFKESLEWQHGSFEGTNFIAVDNEEGKWYIDLNSKKIVTFDKSGLSNVMYYRFDAPDRLLFIEADNAEHQLFLYKTKPGK